MKSFRLYREPPPQRPARFAAGLSDEERTQLQCAFDPVAAKYRLQEQIARYAGLGFVGSIVVFIFFGGMLHAISADWCFVPAMICWLIAFGALATRPRLTCPNCNNDMAYRFGPYCPECGDDVLAPSRWFMNTKCAACGKSLRCSKGGRRYKIRACTHCGLMVDEKGL
jgi:hypothetical protein